MDQILLTVPHKTHHTVETTTSTSASFTSPLKEQVKKPAKGWNGNWTTWTTVESRKDIQFIEQSHENTNQVLYTAA